MPDGGVSKTLNNRATDADHVPCVLIEKKVYDAYRRHNYEEMKDVCQTVSTFYGTGGATCR